MWDTLLYEKRVFFPPKNSFAKTWKIVAPVRRPNSTLHDYLSIKGQFLKCMLAKWIISILIFVWKQNYLKNHVWEKTYHIARRQKYLLDLLFHSKYDELLGSCKIHEWRKHLVTFFCQRICRVIAYLFAKPIKIWMTMNSLLR